MTPIETFWTVTAPKLAEKWPDTFKFISSAGRIYNEFYVKDRVAVYDDDLSTSKALALCHDIAEAIGVHVWAAPSNFLHKWTAFSSSDNTIIRNSGRFDSAPLACLAALNSAVEEVTR